MLFYCNQNSLARLFQNQIGLTIFFGKFVSEQFIINASNKNVAICQFIEILMPNIITPQLIYETILV